MNPITGALKFLSSNIFNAVVALIFFLIVARISDPSFVGKIAILQLFEIVTAAVFSLLPAGIITREISHKLGQSAQYENYIHTSLTYAIAVSPLFLLIFLLPSYLWLSIPYYILFLYNIYQGSILSALGKFTEVNVGNVIFTLTRWGFSIIAVFYNSLSLLIIIWIVGALIKTVYYQLYIPSFKLQIDINLVKEVIRIGLPIYLSSLVGFISGQGDRLITAYFLGSYELGIYQLVALASTVPPMIANSFSSALLPSAAYYYGKGADLKDITSVSFRLLTLISLPLGIIAYVLSPIFITKLFPEYVSGIKVMQLLVLFLTLTIPLQLLSQFLIVAKKNYRPFLLITTISAIEVASISYFLIPKLSILGAAIAQAVSLSTVGILYLYYSVSQRIFELNKKSNLAAIALIGISFISLISWIPALILIILGIRFLGVIKRDDIKIVERFVPRELKGIIKLMYLLSSSSS